MLDPARLERALEATEDIVNNELRALAIAEIYELDPQQETLDLPCSGSGLETQVWDCPECGRRFAAADMRLGEIEGLYIVPEHLPRPR